MKKRIISIIICLCILISAMPTFAVISDKAANLAIGKPSNVENMIDGYPAANVNDGDIYSFWTGGSTVDYEGAANLGLKSGWQVDLQAEYKLVSIIVHLRNDVDQGTRHKFAVSLSNDPKFTESVTVFTDNSPEELPRGTIITVDVTQPEAYRYVRVARTDAGYFALSEVEVYGQEKGVGEIEFSGEKYEKAVNLLKYLEIYDEDFAPDRLPGRAETLQKILMFCGIRDFGMHQTQSYVDVKPDSPYYNAVEFAHDIGIIEGDGKGMFAPEERVTSVQFLKMLLFTLGHDYISSKEKYYSAEIINIASRYKLYNNVGEIKGDFLTEAQMAMMFYNAFTMPMVEAVKYDGKVSYNKNEETVLGSLYNLKEYKGIITASGVTSLESEQAKSKGYIQIGGEDYIDKTGAMHNYLGQMVTFFVNTSRTDEVVLFVPDSRNKELIINGNDINEKNLHSAVA